MDSIFDRRPILLALAGQNGAGKTTFYRTYLRSSGLPFVNADEIARDLGTDPYKAASIADVLRRNLFEDRRSFIFETVLSDPVGDKIEFLRSAQMAGYTVVLFFIGTRGAELSEERVAMRVLKGGHDVPSDKLRERYPRVLQNLRRALSELSNIRVYDNSDLRDPYRLVARKVDGAAVESIGPTPAWLEPLLPTT